MLTLTAASAAVLFTGVCASSSSVSSSSDDAAAIALRHPRDGAAVRVGFRAVLDVSVWLGGSEYDSVLPGGVSLCLRSSSSSDAGAAARQAAAPASASAGGGGAASPALTPWACFDDVSSLSLTAVSAGPLQLELALVLEARPAAAAAALASSTPPRAAARASAAFTADAASHCAERLGEAGCGEVPRLHCASLSRFRFFLYESARVPSAEAAELFYALRDSPLRTLAGGAGGDACVHIAVGDVYAANVHVRECAGQGQGVQSGRVGALGSACSRARRCRPSPCLRQPTYPRARVPTHQPSRPPQSTTMFVESRRYTRLEHWNGTGAGHLLFFFSDHAPPFDTGRAMLAGSAFGARVDGAFFRPAAPESVPQPALARAGYDVVAPLPFYRCGLPIYGHLHRFDELLPPAARLYAGALADVHAARRAQDGSGGGGSVDESPPLSGALFGVEPAWGGAEAAAWSAAALRAPLGVPPAADRRLTLVFRGAAYDGPEGYGAAVRSGALRGLADDVALAAAAAAAAAGSGNGSYLATSQPPAPLPASVGVPDVRVVLTCAGEAPACGAAGAGGARLRTTTSRDARCSEWEAEAVAPSADFAALLLAARFAAVAPGEGTHSYRLYEALQAGAVPVLLGDAAAHPPLANTLPWARAAVLQRDTSPEALAALLLRLRAAPLAVVASMQATGRAIWLSALASLPQQVMAVFAETAALMREARARIRRATENKALRAAAAAAAVKIAAAAATEGAAEGASPLPAASSRFAACTAVLLAGRIAATEMLSAAQSSVLAPAQAAAAAEPQELHHAAADAARLLPLAPPGSSRVLGRALALHLSLLRTAQAAAAALAGSAPRENGGVAEDWAGARAAADAAASSALRGASFLYSAVGAWRLSATAAAAAALLTITTGSSAEESEAAVARVRTATLDARRDVNLDALAATGVLTRRARGAAAPALRPARLSDALTDGDAARLSGYGALAHFLPPTALAPLFGAGAALLPVSPCTLADAAAEADGGAACAASERRADAVLPIAAVGEAALLRVAAALRDAPELRADALAASRAAASANDAAPARALGADGEGGGESSVAIVSLCAYNASATAVGALSLANLDRYCLLHGLACFAATESADGRRATAWSKLLLLARIGAALDAQALAATEAAAAAPQPPAWLLWKDCDSFIMQPATPPRALIAAAAAARARIAVAAAKEALAGAAARGASPAQALSQALPGERGGHTVTGGDGDGDGDAAFLAIGSTSADLIISEDAFMLNSGVFALRRGRWARSLLRRVYGDASATAAPPEDWLAIEAVRFGDVGGGLSLLCRDSGSCVWDGEARPARWAAAGAPLPAGTPQRVLSAPRSAAAHASAGDDDWQAIEAALLHAAVPFERNRAWEQGSLFALLALPGTAAAPARFLEAGSAAKTATAPIDGDRVGYLDACGAADAAVPTAPQLTPAAATAAFSDARHVQAVPQRWINAYPPALAAQLRDGRGRALHAAYATGDWLVSFSGCGVLLGASACEALYAEYAAAGAGAAGALEETRAGRIAHIAG